MLSSLLEGNPEGSSVTANVYDAPAKPVLVALKPITNQQSQSIAGSTTPGAEVTVHVSRNHATPVKAGTTLADGNGQFALPVTIGGEGTYEFKAVALLNGLLSPISDPVQTTVDVTPPEKPILGEWTSAAFNEVTLRWKKPVSGETPSEYSIYRNESKIAATSNEFFQDSNLSELSLNTYKIYSVDAAGNSSTEGLTIWTGTTEQKSVLLASEPAYKGAGNSSISADGSTIVFTAETETWHSFYFENVKTKEIVPLQLPADIKVSGIYAINENAKVLAFTAQTSNAFSELFMKNMLTGILTPVTNGKESGRPTISADGLTILFSSYDPLTPEDTDRYEDLYVYRVATQTLERLNLMSNGDFDRMFATSRISGDGKWVVYSVTAPDAPEWSETAYIHNVVTGQTVLIGEGFLHPSISRDGRYVAYFNVSQQHIEVYDRQSGTKQTLYTGEIDGDITINELGTHVLYSTYDPITGRESLIWHPLQNGESKEIGNPSQQETDYTISKDGSKVVYTSYDVSQAANPSAVYMVCPAVCSDIPPPNEQPIRSVSWEASAMLQREAELGSRFTVKLIGASGSTAKATISYNQYLPDGLTLESKQSIISLIESDILAGQYAGGIDLIEGIKEVNAVTVEVTDSKGTTSSRNAENLPLQVSGSLALMLDQTSAELNGARIVVWSESKKTGNQSLYTGEIPVTVKLQQGSDYRITLLNARGQVLSEGGPITVRNGQVTKHPMGVRIPATLSIRVINEQGAGIPNVPLQLTRPEDLKVIASSSTNPMGNAIFTTGYVGEVVTVTARLPYPYVQQSVVRQVVLDRAVIVEFQAEALKKVLKGIVRDEQGQPVQNAIVTLTQPGFTQSASTGTDGAYEIEGLVGRSTIEATQIELPYLRSRGSEYVDVSITPSKDLVLYQEANARVQVDLFTKKMQGDWEKVDWSSQARLQYRLSVKDSKNITKSFDKLSNAIQFQASPGETFQVCASEIWDEFTPACVSVTLNEQRQGTVDIRLAEQSGIHGKVVYDAEKVVKADVVAYELDSTGKRRGGGRTYTDVEGDFTIHLQKTGNYLLEWIVYTGQTLQQSVRMYKQVAVLPDQITELGEIELKTTGIFSKGVSNQLIALASEVQENTTLSLRGSYRNESDKPVTEAELLLHIPGGTELVEGSVTLNGSSVQAVSQSSAVYKVAVGDIPALAGGNLTYRLRIGEGMGAYIRPELRIGYKQDGVPTEDTIDSVLVRIVNVSLVAPPVTQSLSFSVNGRAPAGSTVLVYDGDQLLGAALASPGGYWNRQVTLRNLPLSPRHAMIAKAIVEEREMRSEEKFVKVDSAYPVPMKLTVEQGSTGKITVDVSKEPARFPFAVNPTAPMFFSLTFSDADKVEDVKLYVGGGEVPMVYNTFEGAFTGVKIGNNKGLANAISVDYKVKPDPYAYPYLTQEEWRKTLPESIQKLNVSIKESSLTNLDELADPNREVLPTVVISSDEHPGMKAEVTISGTAIPNYIPDPLPPDQPRIYNLRTSRRILSDNTIEMTISAIIPRQSAGDLFGAQSFSTTAEGGFMDLSIKTNVGNYYDLYDTIKSSFEYKDKMKEIEDFLHAAESTGCMPSGRIKYYENMAVQLADHAFSNLLWNYTGTLASIGLAASGFGLIMGIAVGAITFGISYLQVEEYERNFAAARANLKADQAAAAQDPECNDPNNPSPPPVPRIPQDPDSPSPYYPYDPIAEPAWIYDPSGYVFEGVPSNRVKGVRATVTNQDTDDGTWSVWDAGWYNQQNPQITDKEGRYGWDVPEGNWQVLFDKEGYETAHSEVLTVLPPHFDVNVPIVSREAPEVTSIYPVENGTILQVEFNKYMIPPTVGEDTITLTRIVNNGAEKEQIQFHVEPVDLEKDLTDREFARTYRFIPDGTAFVPGETVQVRIGPAVFSYAQVPMIEAFEKSIIMTQHLPIPQEAVQNVRLIPGTHSIGLTWTELANEVDFDHILVYAQELGSDQPNVVQVDKGAHVFAIDDVKAATDYQFRIVTVNRYGNQSEGVNVVGQSLPTPQLTIDSTPPQSVTELKATVARDTLTLTWNDPADWDFHDVRVYIRKKGDLSYGEPAVVGNGVGLYSINGLTNGIYEIKLTAVDLIGNESTDATVSATVSLEDPSPDTTPPQEVGQLAAKVENNQLTLTWSDPSDSDLQQINIYVRKPGSEAYEDPIVIGKTVGTYIWSQLEKGLYVFKLTTKDSTGNESAGIVINVEIESNTEVIQVAAGVQDYSVFDKELKLHLPEGSIPAGTKISVHREPVKALQTRPFFLKPKSSAFTLESNVHPSKRVTLTLKYAKDGLKGLDYRKLGIYRYDPKFPFKWKYVGGKVDAANEEIKVDVNEWGTYAVMSFGFEFPDHGQHWDRNDVDELISRDTGTTSDTRDPDHEIKSAELIKLIEEFKSLME